jgi:hypothetical protein
MKMYVYVTYYRDEVDTIFEDMNEAIEYIIQKRFVGNSFYDNKTHDELVKSAIYYVDRVKVVKSKKVE